MPTTEHTVNDALAAALRKTRRVWRESVIVSSEQSSVLRESSGRPDILVQEPNVSPVAIEVEIMPAINVEKDATDRLGTHIRGVGLPILSSVAVRLQADVRSLQGGPLLAYLEGTPAIEMALTTGTEPANASRWPREGWLTGAVADLSFLVQMASIPPAVVDEAVRHLVAGVTDAAGLLNQMAVSNPGAIHTISRALYQEDGEQTRRMAGAILANALMFHEILAGGEGELAAVQSLEQLRGSGRGIDKSEVLSEWRTILKVNYWPIFDVARRILEVVPTSESQSLIEGLADTAQNLLHNRLMRSHDLTGAVFQRLIVDRQFLAAYYTTPASASLLVGLVITPDTLGPLSKSWSDPQDIKSLRVADFACGTGTLLSTAYQRISHLHEIAGGDAEAIHPEMMASALLGCDVLPAAAHLTASMLSGAHPTARYTSGSIMTLAYGKQPDGSIALGSLDLLDPQGRFEVLSITARTVDSMGESELETWRSLPHASFDIVLMNPPFTRPTSHEGRTANVPNPVFAAFSSTAEEQQLMARAMERLTSGSSAHGNAGEASIFLVLAHRKLKQNGAMGLVLPLSLLAGDSWEDSRRLLADNYAGLIVVSIAGGGSGDMSFSADTGMGECLVVGRKSDAVSSRATFVVLTERPAYSLAGAAAAQQIHRLISSGRVHRLEDGPVGGTPVYFGNELIGHVLDAPLPSSGGWNLGRIADFSLAQSAYQLAYESRLWLPGTGEEDSLRVPITTVGAIGQIGPIHRDINGKTPAGGFRGPFDIAPSTQAPIATYPVLWSHEADRERTILFDADCEALPRQGETAEEREALAQKVAAVSDSASHCHFNCDFRFNSQSTGMQYTPRSSIGGRAWLSIRLPTPELEKALVLWANTSLGLLLRWWHSNKQQSGRGSIGRSTLHTTPILDATALTPRQLDAALAIFDEMSKLPLEPLHRMDEDINRQRLDERFAVAVLGLPQSLVATGGPLEILRLKLSREPSVRGRK